MFTPVSAFIGLRYARSGKGNSFISFINRFSVAGITLGLAALITSLSVMNGLEAQLKQRILGLMPHVVTTAGQVPDITEKPLSDHVSDVLPYIETEAVLQSRSGLQGVMIQGLEVQQTPPFDLLRKHMVAGQLDSLKVGQYHLVIGRRLATKLGLNIGDQVRLISASASTFTPFGRLPSQRLFTVSAIYDIGSEYDDKVVLANLADIARLLRSPLEKVQQSRLYLNDAFDYQTTTQYLDRQSINYVSWRDRQGPLFDAVKMEKNMMALMLILVIAVAAFNIVSALVMVVTEKQSDIAILRTQGMSRERVMAIFLINGCYNGLKGALFGLIVGLLLVSQLNNILALAGSPIALDANGSGLPIDVQWHQIVTVTLSSTLLCFLATLYPAYKAVKIAPAQVLRYE
ncbi:lipoprotein-releasing ABC transporter permease subunit [Aestuariibacter salexigens]|uniref:lipoprotein-releasing ABC transporter permease subunit n=1 Tax=Aestuariibacter salexigens TaxID=226010 RepID=UPI0003F7C26A|nr:lipoprotein-releasing ABC transporter permease subunit [Aestuariibacter salexigens]